MEQRKVNPWTWQDQYGFSQAIEVTNAGRTLYCSGQTSNDADGVPLHAGNMKAQLVQTLDNLETVLQKAGYELGNVVRITVFTTSMDEILGVYGTLVERLSAAGCQPSSTLVEVNRLAFPEFMVEIEATAVA